MQRPAVRAYIGLGSNLGNTLNHLRAASLALAQLPHSQLVQVSSIYQSAALNTDNAVVKPASGGDYLNAVAALETALTAPALLQALQSIEQQAGRQRPHRNAPRTLDLDLLLYGSACIASAALQVPHPRMLQRAFVLQPLAEIASGQVSAAQLQAVQDQRIERISDELCIRPLKRSLSGLIKRLAKFSADFMVKGRGEHTQHERDAL